MRNLEGFWSVGLHNVRWPQLIEGLYILFPIFSDEIRLYLQFYLWFSANCEVRKSGCVQMNNFRLVFYWLFWPWYREHFSCRSDDMAACRIGLCWMRPNASTSAWIILRLRFIPLTNHVCCRAVSCMPTHTSHSFAVIKASSRSVKAREFTTIIKFRFEFINRCGNWNSSPCYAC